ncbi:MAG: FecR domain-containing protein [Opitutaceae bacterium]|jgi:transmembrane sensor
MNSNPQCLDPAAEEQAALWAAQLDGSTLTAADRTALDVWLAQHPVHRTLLSRYCQFSADLEQLLPVLVATGGVEMPPDAAPRRAHRWLAWGTGAGLAAAAAAVALVAWLGRPQTQSENLATPAAQRRALTLVDGTRVELDAQTSLRIDIDAKERRVRLASGEAFFAVHQDATRPFIVETPAGSVQVTGTQFAVRADSPAAFEVTVLEGSVQARPDDANGRPTAPVLLHAGEQLSAGPAGVQVHALTPATLDDALAWRQGRIVFAGMPLREALARYARYNGCGITVAPDAADLPVSLGGRYSLDDLDGFLAQLEMSLPVRVTRSLNGTVQVSLRPEH